MSGFEVIGVILGALPVLETGLKFYKPRVQYLVNHEVSMQSLIDDLEYEHLRFYKSSEALIGDLVMDDELTDLLDNATEQKWKDILSNGLDQELQLKLGKTFHFCNRTVLKLAEKLAMLGKVVGLEDDQSWTHLKKYHKSKGHREAIKKIKDCLDYNKHQQLLAEIHKANDQLEKLLPTVEDSEQDTMPKPRKADLARWESLRRSAKSLYAALCSRWICGCQATHMAHFQLDPMESIITCHQFNISFSISKAQNGQMSQRSVWRDVVVSQDEEEDDEDNILPITGFRTRVNFSPGTTPTASSPSLPILDEHIQDFCNAIQKLDNQQKVHPIGFVSGAKRKHYIHLAKRPSNHSIERAAISLQTLLDNNGKMASPRPLCIQLLNQYELALCLASSLLQLHTTSWLDSSWKAGDIHFISTQASTRLRDCAFITKMFPATGSNVHVDQPTSSPTSRSIVIRNEAIFGLGTMLVEISTKATLKSQEIDSDRAIPELADFVTAERLAKENQRNCVREWNNVVRLCLRGSFSCDPDWTKKEFRWEFYRFVVAPLQKIYDDAKLD